MQSNIENTKKVSHSFEINSLIVLVLTMIANVLGVIFQSLSGHLLNDTQLYADLNAVMALFNILVLPTTVASCFISKYTAKLHAQQTPEKIKSLLLKAVKVLSLWAAIFGLIMMAMYRVISIWLHMEDSVVIFLAIILALLTLFSSIFTGGLQGSKAFVLYGVFGLIGPFYKIIAVVFSPLFDRKLVGILLVWIIGTLISYLIGILLLKKVLGRYKVETISLNERQAIRYIAELIVANASVILFTNIDILMVKHSFNQDAGLYSAARMISFCITYFANAFVVVLFPIVAEGTRNEREKLRLLKKSLIYNILLSIVLVILLAVFFDIGIRVLLGNEYFACKKYLIPVMMYVFPISVMNLLSNYGMAEENTKFITCSLFVSCGFAAITGLIVKESIMSLIFYLDVIMWVVVICNIVYIFHKDKFSKKIGKYDK